MQRYIWIIIIIFIIIIIYIHILEAFQFMGVPHYRWMVIFPIPIFPFCSLTEVIGGITRNFASFWESECTEMKDARR